MHPLTLVLKNVPYALQSGDQGDKKGAKMKQIESLAAEIEELLRHEGNKFSL